MNNKSEEKSIVDLEPQEIGDTTSTTFQKGQQTMLRGKEKTYKQNLVLVFTVNFLLRFVLAITTMLALGSMHLITMDSDALDGIARYGYASVPLSQARELPLIPLLMRGLYLIGVPPTFSQLWISIVAASLMMSVFYAILEQEGNQHAMLITLVFSFQPYFPNLILNGDAIWLASFLFLVSYYAFRQGRRGITAILVVLLSMTHILGVIYATAMLTNIFRKKWNYLVFLLAPATLLCEFLYFYAITGDFLLYVHAQQAYWFSGDVISNLYPFGSVIQILRNLQDNINAQTVLAIALVFLSPFIFYQYRHDDKLYTIIAVFIVATTLVHALLARYLTPIIPLYIITLFSYLERSKRWDYKYLKILIPVLIIIGFVMAFLGMTSTAYTNWAEWGTDLDPNILP